MANLFTQTGFEVDASNIESNGVFGAFLAATFVRSTVRAHTGSASLQVTWPTPDGTHASWVNHFSVSGFIVGRMYRLSCWAYVPSGSPDMNARVAFTHDGPGFNTKDAWFLLYSDFVATATNHFCGFGTDDQPVGGTVAYLDDWNVDVLLNNGTLDADTPSPLILDQQLVRGTWKSPLELPLISADLTGHMAHTRRILTPSGWRYMNRVKWPTP